MIKHGHRLFAAAILVSGAASAADLEKAPPAFQYQSQTVVPIDIKNIELKLDFDYQKQQVVGNATVTFYTEQDGWPMLDLVPQATSLALDGASLTTADFPEITDPDQSSRFHVVKKVATQGVEHKLQLSYVLNDHVTYTGGAVRAGFFMTDLSQNGRGYWEQFGPAGFEYDQFQQTIDVTVTGTSVEHELFVNGDVTKTGDNSWHIVYPDYFTISSFYFHMADKGHFQVARGEHQGLEATIPLTVYAASSSEAQRGLANLQKYLTELENDYGAFAHKSFTAYITPNGGGMEYCGATITSLWALGHETTHSWFARGVMPANGNAGWIDEAIASWRDDGYPRASGRLRSTRVLGGFSPYRRFTTMDAYDYGSSVISELDGRFASFSLDGRQGMKALLRSLFTEHKRETMTVPMFQAFLEDKTGASLQDYFDKYVYGHSSFYSLENEGGVEVARGGLHPRPFTKEELARLR